MSRERGIRGRASRWRMAAGDTAGIGRWVAGEEDQPDPQALDETEDSDTDIGADTVGGSGSGSPPVAEEPIGAADSVTDLPLSPPRLPNRRRRASPGTLLWLAAAACGGSALLLVLLLAALLREPASSPPPDRQLPEFPELPAEEAAAAGVRPLDADEQQRRREGLSSFAAMGRAEEARLRANEAGEAAGGSGAAELPAER